MNISVQVIGIPQALATLERIRVEQRGSVALAVTMATFNAQGIAMRLTPVKSGRLRAGNKVRQSTGGTQYLIINELYNDVPYAIYVCYGTRKMRARDFFTPALVEARKKLTGYLTAIFGG